MNHVHIWKHFLLPIKHSFYIFNMPNRHRISSYDGRFMAFVFDLRLQPFTTFEQVPSASNHTTEATKTPTAMEIMAQRRRSHLPRSFVRPFPEILFIARGPLKLAFVVAHDANQSRYFAMISAPYIICATLLAEDPPRGYSNIMLLLLLALCMSRNTP